MLTKVKNIFYKIILSYSKTEIILLINKDVYFGKVCPMEKIFKKHTLNINSLCFSP